MPYRFRRPLDDRCDLTERHGEHVVQHEGEPLGGSQRFEYDEQREETESASSASCSGSSPSSRSTIGSGMCTPIGSSRRDARERSMFRDTRATTGVSSFIHLDDAAAPTVLALEHDGAGIYNIVDDEPAPVREWLPVLAHVLGARPPRHPAGSRG